jgi:hypothetical protein
MWGAIDCRLTRPCNRPPSNDLLPWVGGRIFYRQYKTLLAGDYN